MIHHIWLATGLPL